MSKVIADQTSGTMETKRQTMEMGANESWKVVGARNLGGTENRELKSDTEFEKIRGAETNFGKRSELANTGF